MGLPGEKAQVKPIRVGLAALGSQPERLGEYSDTWP